MNTVNTNNNCGHQVFPSFPKWIPKITGWDAMYRPNQTSADSGRLGFCCPTKPEILVSTKLNSTCGSQSLIEQLFIQLFTHLCMSTVGSSGLKSNRWMEDSFRQNMFLYSANNVFFFLFWRGWRPEFGTTFLFLFFCFCFLGPKTLDYSMKSFFFVTIVWSLLLDYTSVFYQKIN